uniref:PLA2(IIA)-Cau1 n=1 Tax=Causus rhombeatus TaxID=44735 RepID=A7X4U6_CAURH|nr:PLA2(IIA)-Cau1 [Causus rhombeatus]
MRTLWIVAVWLMGVEGSLYQFGKMIRNRTGKSTLSYSSYGCYCGWGGQGRPQDPTDRCCFEHDCCYGQMNDCNPKLAHYSYSFKNGDIVCESDNPCLRDLCECDRAAAICFGENLNTYDRKYWFYSSTHCMVDSEQCHMKEKHPPITPL